MPVDDTSDPLLLSWSRTTRPSGCDDPAQRAALAVCVDAAGIDKVAHRLHTMPAAQVRRSLFLALRDAAMRATETDPVFDGLHHMWCGYLRHARTELMRMGERVIIAIYLGWHATVVSIPVADLLTAATRDATSTLNALRAEFHQAIAGDLDEAAKWYLYDRYPIPAEAIQTTIPRNGSPPAVRRLIGGNLKQLERRTSGLRVRCSCIRSVLSLPTSSVRRTHASW